MSIIHEESYKSHDITVHDTGGDISADVRHGYTEVQLVHMSVPADDPKAMKKLLVAVHAIVDNHRMFKNRETRKDYIK
jgi:hypothetical protein